MKFAGIRLAVLISASNCAQKGHGCVTQGTRVVVKQSMVELSVVELLPERIVKRTAIQVKRARWGK